MTSSVERNNVILQLFLVSLLSLFCEMLVIRWLSTEIRVFSYFKNLPLMAAFLGLGLGFLLVDKKTDFLRWSSVLTLYFCGLMIAAIGLGLTHMSFVDGSKIVMFGGFMHGGQSVWKIFGSILTLVSVFALTACIFVGLGQRTGQLFERLKPLEAYSYNVLGALSGIVLFALLSNLQLGPGLWMIVAGILYLVIQRNPASVALLGLGIAYMIFLAPYCARLLYGADYVTTVWSPYYRIDLMKARMSADEKNVSVGYDLFINYDGFQSMLDCTPETLSKVSQDSRSKMLGFFERPFRLLPKDDLNVLILGSGSGSDVAAALRCGASHVDAVEIDGSICGLGKKLHPEHPYDSPKVAIHVMDARTFLAQNADKRYDVIVYGALDSHTAFSSLSSLRTDNYIFTSESFREASKLLKPDGLISVSFVCTPDWLWARQCKNLSSGARVKPRGYFWVAAIPVGLLIAGPSLAPETKLNCAMPAREISLDPAVPEITDDWPFLFLPGRGIPSSYILPLLSVLACCFVPIRRLMLAGSKHLLNWQLFCLGMGFMLLEVRAMSSISLLCGATWTVNSFVIAGVMIAILIANFIAAKISERAVNVLIPLTLVAIIASNLFDIASLNALPGGMGNYLGTAIYLSPLFFAGGVFSTLFKQSSLSSQALAFNMIGGIFGIMIEYMAMCFGIKSLAYAALVIYAAVLVLELRRVKSI